MNAESAARIVRGTGDLGHGRANGDEFDDVSPFSRSRQLPKSDVPHRCTSHITFRPNLVPRGQPGKGHLILYLVVRDQEIAPGLAAVLIGV